MKKNGTIIFALFGSYQVSIVHGWSHSFCDNLFGGEWIACSMYCDVCACHKHPHTAYCKGFKKLAHDQDSFPCETSVAPTTMPTSSPTGQSTPPTKSPTHAPTTSPTAAPTNLPTASPTGSCILGIENSTQLQAEVNGANGGDTIALCSGIINFSNGGSGTVNLYDNLTFECPNGGCVFDGAEENTLFRINDGTTSFNGEFTFQDGFARGGGGAIDIKSGATLNINGPDCTFSGNSADYYGGAIINAGTATITGCDFINNDASRGGAIFNAGMATITGCDFINNEAVNFGGAIFNFGTATITVDDSTFSGNTAASGADIYNRGTTNCYDPSNIFCDGMGTNVPSGLCLMPAPGATYPPAPPGACPP